MRTVTDLEGKTIFPLSQLLNPESLPTDIVEFDRPLVDLFDHLFFTESVMQSIENGYLGKITLVVDQEISVGLFGDVVDLVIGGGGLGIFEVEISLENQPGGFVFNIALVDVSVILRITSNILRPLKPESTEPDLQATGLDIDLGSVSIRVGTSQPIDVEFIGSPTVPQCMIGDTGIILSITEFQWLTPGSESMPENTPPEFSGLYLEQMEIQLPEGLNNILPDDVTLEDFFIGNAGFSGKVTGNWEADPENPFSAESGDVFGFRFRLTSIGIEFKQNALISGSITGYLELPFFDEVVEVNIGLTNGGGYTIGIANLEEILTLSKPGVLTFDVSSLEFISDGNSFSIKLSGNITPLIADITWPSFELKGLTISSDGTVKVDGGWIELPEQKALDFHGFKIEISKLGFGSDEEDGSLFKWIGFSGGIQIVESLPLKGGVEGLKVMWTEGGLIKLKIGGVYLSFEIDNVVKFDGSVFFIDEEGIKEFRGGVNLDILPINLGVNAQFITGRTTVEPLYNYFYIAIELDLPVGIPLGPPVLGLYGLAGLYANNMTLDYQSLINYDSVENRPDLTDASPNGEWFNQEGAMAFGAGLTVGTLPDSKFTVKAKALLVILIPGPVLLIEGHAGMVSTGDNYLMRVLAVLDPVAGSFLLNIGATYQFPKNSGELIDIEGSAEAFFSASDPANWHLYLGQNTPEAKRIRADILSLFKAQTYLMVDGKGLLMGAWIGYGLNKKYGILRVVLEAWISGELALSTMPLQAKGTIMLYGNAELSASIVSLGISVMATVSAQAPKPLSMYAAMEVQLKTPLGKPKATITLKWENTKTPAYPVPLSNMLGVEHRKVTKTWEIPKYSLYAVDDDGLYTTTLANAAIPPVPVVPPDVYLSISFDKPVIDTKLIGANPAPAPSTYEQVGDYEFKYELVNITLQCCDAWDEQDMDKVEWINYIPTVGDYELTGDWQFIPGATQNNTKLFLNATTPFEISRVLSTTDMWYSMLEVYDPGYPCLPEFTEEKICADVEERQSGTYYYMLVEDRFIFTSIHFLFVRDYNAPWLGTHNALTNSDRYTTTECLNIKAQEPSGRLNIKIVKGAVFTAGVGYDSYLQLTNEYSEADVELYINRSLSDPPLLPAAIHFPQTAFPDLPYRVWITCVIKNAPDLLFRAFDENGTLLDTAHFVSENAGLHVYKLESTTTPIRHITILADNLRILEVCYEELHIVKLPSILITPPEDIVNGELHLSKNSQGIVYLYDRENREVKQVEFDIPSTTADEDMRPLLLSLESGASFRSFLVTGDFDIIRVCGIAQEAHDTYEFNQSLRNHLQTSLEETWGQHTSQLLEPGKYYRLMIETRSSRSKNNGPWEGMDFVEYMFFKTGNPPGPPAPTQEEVVNVADRYDLDGPLTSLALYIDYTIPANATADEAQTWVYRTYDVGVVYNDSYIEQMYLMAEVSVSIRLLDNNNHPVTDSAGVELTFVNAWGDNPELAVTREEEQYQDILLTSPCVVTTTLTAESETEIIAASRELLLSPLTQYRAQVMAGVMNVFEFTFLTSRYASFLHHIHSFEGILWDHFALLQEETYEADRTLIQQVLVNAEEESVRAEQLMDLFEINPRAIPERVEVTLLTDRIGAIAFLLETPEPFDWERTELTLSHSSTSLTPAITGDTVTIIGGSLAPVDGLFNNQWIDILLKDTLILEGYTLEYATLPEQEIFEAFHTFTEGVLNAGTWIRVYNGNAPQTPDETEFLAIYAGHRVDLSSSDGIVVQLKNNDGAIVHTLALYDESVWSTVNFQMVRNGDGTRCFLFVTSPHVITAGTYQLHFTYKRNTETGSPILKRFGFSDSEATAIRFST